jgi:hypothetical protein
MNTTRNSNSRLRIWLAPKAFGVGIWSLGALAALAPFTGPAQSAPSTNTISRLDYGAFQLVTDRNIFNTRRSHGYVVSDRPRTDRTVRTDAFALVGTMSYGKGPFAFFDGSRSEYKKVLKPDETIGDFKVTGIEPASVKLASSTNEIELKVGMQLERQENGAWLVGVRPESAEPSPGPLVTSHLQTVNRAPPQPEPDAGAGPPDFPNVQALQSFISNAAAALGAGGAPPPQNGATNAAPASPAGAADPVSALEMMRRRAAAERGD